MEQDLGITFDGVASEYARMRPGYMPALYKALFDYQPLDSSSRVLEIGIGGGQATLPILETGCRLTAVDRGRNFASLCRRKFGSYPGFSVLEGRFEDIELEHSEYDFVYSASAFHWIPESVGYQKVFDVLKPGGAFARFANHPYRSKWNPGLTEAIGRLYAIYYYAPKGLEPEKLVEYSEDQARERAEIARKYGFVDVRYQLFYRTRTFSASDYVALLGTYSDHIAMDAGLRAEFYEKVAEAIDGHGGIMELYDTLDLQLARKPLV